MPLPQQVRGFPRLATRSNLEHRKVCTSFTTDCLITLIAAAAARINASLQARKGIQHVDVPPIQNSSTPDAPSAAPSKGAGPPPALDGEMYTADGDYIQDIEVNDLRNRYLITKGSTQKMVNTTLAQS